jgi:hypothetical protein
MKIIHLEGYTENERSAFRDVVHSNIVMCIKALIQACENFELKLNKKNKVRFARSASLPPCLRHIITFLEVETFVFWIHFPNLFA